MANYTAVRFLAVLLAVLLQPAIAQEVPDKVKALAAEKALLDAQAARDSAEAARIKASGDLANAKAASEKAAFDAKVARDNAEASAVKAAAELATAKALAANTEKATLDAKAARDAAEAAAVKAAADLAVAKALAANTEKPALDAKAARDAAEAAATKAAADLLKAKAAAGNVEADISKSRLEAEAALATAKVAAQAAEIVALKAVFGAAPSIGTDGNVSISDSTAGMLLESKSGSLKATGALALKLCEVLAEAGIKGAFIAPVDLERKALASKFVLREYRNLLEVTKDGSAASILLKGDVTSQISAAGVLSAVSLLQYGAGALQTIAKMFKSDYAVAVTDGKREVWLEYFMAAHCSEQLPFTNVEGAVRARGFDSDMEALNKLADFGERAAAHRTFLKQRLDDAAQAVAKKVAAGQSPTTGESGVLTNAKENYGSTSALDRLAVRIKALVDVVTTKTDVFIDALVWDAFATAEYKGKPRLSIVFTTQDGQVTKSNWLFGKSVYGRSSGEVIYRVSGVDGKIKLAGYLVATNADGKIDFSANMTPIATGRTYLAPK